jgi:aspartate aminotransferase
MELTMTPLSNRIAVLSESQTIAMARKTRELIAKGVDIISLTLGEPDFSTPQHIKEVAKKAIDDNFSYYTHVSGYLELRQAISRKFKRDNNLDYTPDQIVVSTGAKQSIINAVYCLINPGDEVIIPSPYWVSYVEMVKLAEGKPVVVKTSLDNDYKITPEQLRKAITPKTKLIMFSSPCNPTGSLYSKSELKAMAEVVAEHPQMYIISDEIYEHINFDGKHESIAQFDFIKDKVITVNGVSKAFAMTGWRVGFIGASPEIAKACDKMQGQFTSATCSIAQKATHAAMEMDPTAIHPMRDAFRRRRDLVYSKLKEIKGLRVNEPKGAFYFFPNVTYYFGKSAGNITIRSGSDLSNYLLETAYISVVPGAAFGDDDCIRISYSTSEERLTEALRRMKEALDKLV